VKPSADHHRGAERGRSFSAVDMEQKRFSDGLLRPSSHLIAAGQRLCDSIVIVGALVLCTRIYEQEWRHLDSVAVCAATLVYYVISEFNGLYRTWRGAGLIREIGQMGLTWASTVAVLLLVAFATKETEEFSRVVITGWFILVPNIMTVARIAARFCLQELRRSGRNSRKAVIVGMTPMAQRLAENLSDPTLGMKLVGFYDDRTPSRRHRIDQPAVPFRGGTEDLVRHVREERIDYVYIALPLRAERRTGRIVEQLSDTTASVFVLGDFFVFDLLHAQWTAVGDLPVVGILDTPFRGVGGWLKRLEDIVLGSAILLLISIPMLVIAILVKLTSPGPVFFVQRRYGLNGNEIPVIKFRTMTVCEDGAEVQQARVGDRRVTRLGAFLRRTSLDELPQFFNVLAGHMSIVGPRPHAVAHNEHYRSRIRRYMLRHKVKPGITGWAQVNGWRGETETLDKMEKRLEHDLYYIHHWNLGLDLRIIFLTVFGKKVRSNAY
jgi:putative colanic acid biosysnthesis UDP-glucose lipid carrier transferase